jgi:hypothetical protein
MPALNRTADASHARRSSLPPPGRLHPKASGSRSGCGRAIAVRAIGAGAGQIARIDLLDGDLRRGRWQDQRLQDHLGLDPVVGPGRGHHRRQRQAVFVGR